MLRYLFPVLLTICLQSQGQSTRYSTANAHAHNDYENPFPFWGAWRQGFGSIEADIFLEGGELLVAHEPAQLKRHWTLDSLYLQPLAKCMAQQDGFVYKDTSRSLQLMLDIKTAAGPTLHTLVEKLKQYPLLISSGSLKIVISGNRPPASGFNSLPSWIRFDGELEKDYSSAELTKIEMLSANFRRFSNWNGKGRLPEPEKQRLSQLVEKAHRVGKTIRFWNAPDIINSWYAFIDLGIDYINTDQVEHAGSFFSQLQHRFYRNNEPYEPYAPKWRNDARNKRVKNVILLIGDGTGLAQWYAGYTANNGRLNVFNMHYTGLSKTSSYDNYITDSAPGATAFSAGEKTNNRAVGVDHTGKPLTLLPELVRQKKMKAGIITSGDFRDATPAAFYAHQQERSNYRAIGHDLVNAKLDLLMGAGKLDQSTKDSIAQFNKALHLVADETAAKPAANGRGKWLINAFDTAVDMLSKQGNGFLLVAEAAQVDHGGHANKLPYAVSELLDFDRLIGRVMEFADRNGETLVIVTGDHETGGLTLTAGDYETGTVSGQFSTGDHTAIPVPVFAYGPRSYLFGGVYENTEIFKRILKALGIQR